MRVLIINRDDETAYVDGLPERGYTPAGESRYFPVSPFMLYGRDGSGGNIAENLQRAETAGKIYYEIELDKNDIGCIGRKLLRVLDTDLTDDDAAQTFQSAAFPVGSRLLGGRLNVVELYNNSDAAFAAGTALLDFGLDDSQELFIANLDIELASGTVGEKLFAVSTALSGNAQTLVTTVLAGMNIGGKKMQLVFTNSAGAAHMNESTAGEFVAEVLYQVGPGL